MFLFVHYFLVFLSKKLLFSAVYYLWLYFYTLLYLLVGDNLGAVLFLLPVSALPIIASLQVLLGRYRVPYRTGGGLLLPVLRREHSISQRVFSKNSNNL